MKPVDVRLMRYRLGESLAALAAPADEQIDQLRRQGGFPIAELARDFWDWLDRLPDLELAGALSEAAIGAIERVNAAILEVDTASAGPVGTPYLWTEEALRTDPRWQQVRAAAQIALAAFSDLGVPAPLPADPGFNGPREDAP
jgi:hypothetical protein